MENIKAFFYGVKKEVERVRWPNRKNMIKYSTAVLIFSLFFSMFFYIINVAVVVVKDVLN